MKRAEPVTVLHVNDKLSMDGVNPSSVTVLFGDWGLHLKALGFRVAVATLRDPDPAATYLQDRGISVHCLGPGSFSWTNLGGIARTARTEGAQILHLHGYASADFGRIAGRRLGVPSIVHEHAVLPVRPHQYLADRVLRRHTDCAVAVSNYVKSFMIRGRCIPEEKIRVIGNGVRLDRFAECATAEVDNIRAELGLSGETKIVGTVTRLRVEKGNEYLIRAISNIRDEVGSLAVLIVGDGPLRRELEELARQLGVADIVRFLGFRNDVPALVRLFDVHVIPSLTEGFPLALVEAMAAERAIVATQVGGMPEVAQDGTSVMFVPPRDPQALARTIVQLLGDQPLRARLARQAAQCSRQYSIENNAQKLADLYLYLAHR